MATTFTTGTTILSDIGTCSYNGCSFSPNFYTRLSADPVADEAGRTTKYTHYKMMIDGYVTVPSGSTNIVATMATLYDLLTAQRGILIYTGRGHDLTLNGAGAVRGGKSSSKRDVMWGPKPKLLEFQPLGGGLSAKVKWECEFALYESPPGGISLLQLNYEASITYGEDGFSSLALRGITEIPSSIALISGRVLSRTVDNFREQIEKRILSGIDLSRFRVTNREFNISRDKRTSNWAFQIEEKPYMDLPPFCTLARGTFSVRPARSGFGLVTWHCTLRATYTLAKRTVLARSTDVPRRTAWLHFLALLRLRMNESRFGTIPPVADGGEARRPPPKGADPIEILAYNLYLASLKSSGKDTAARKALILSFSFDEGLYLDSKSISFSATWQLITSFESILRASGLWTKVPEYSTTGKNIWATAMKDVVGTTHSWLFNKLDPKLDIIVDFGADTV